MLRPHAQGGVLLGDDLDGAAQVLQCVNVHRIGHDGAGQGPLLKACHLIRRIENAAQRRMRLEEPRVEHLGHLLRPFGEDWAGRLDGGDGGSCSTFGSP